MSARGGLGLVLATALIACAVADDRAPSLPASLLPALPGTGVAGAYAGIVAGGLLVAGGADFPVAPPWAGGSKVWHDEAWHLASPQAAWRPVGRLPAAAAYGVSVTLDDGLLCIGGGDGQRHFADCFLLSLAAAGLERRTWPRLPLPLAFASGALVGRTVFVAGGLATPDAVAAERRLFALDLDASPRRWRELAPLPGDGRMLSVAAACDGAFYLCGGVALVGGAGDVQRRYLRDVVRYEPQSGVWRALRPLPGPLAGAPSPAPADDGGFRVLGGDDGGSIGVDPQRHPGFSDAVLRYDRRADRWSRRSSWPRTLSPPPVTTTAVLWNGSIVVPAGEIRPGVRTPAVVRLPGS